MPARTRSPASSRRTARGRLRVPSDSSLQSLYGLASASLQWNARRRPECESGDFGYLGRLEILPVHRGNEIMRSTTTLAGAGALLLALPLLSAASRSGDKLGAG